MRGTDVGRERNPTLSANLQSESPNWVGRYAVSYPDREEFSGFTDCVNSLGRVTLETISKIPLDFNGYLV